MKVLITGSGGQLGKEWVQFCEQNEIHFSDFSSSELDITNTSLLKQTILKHQPDVIINCAAYTKVDEAEEEKINATQINATSVHKMATLCNELNIKLVHFSTDYVFSGNVEDQSKFPDGYPENHERKPVNEYGYSKYLGEKALEESGCDYLLIRVSWLCGKYGNNFVKTMLRLGKKMDNLSVVDDQFGSPTFTDQVVKHTFQLITANESGIFHISSEGIISWYEFALEIFKEAEINIELKKIDSSAYPTKAKRPSFSKLSTQKISNIDGVSILNWKDGLKRLLKQL